MKKKQIHISEGKNYGDYITCEICNKKIDDLSGNPNLWGVALPYKGGNGKIKYYHRGCVANIINKHLDTKKIKDMKCTCWRCLGFDKDFYGEEINESNKNTKES